MSPMKLHKKINVLFLGLEDSGKSFAISSIAGKYAEEISSNVRKTMIKDGGFYVEMTEVHQNIEEHFVKAHGVVFCMDRRGNIDEAKKLLRSILTHPQMEKKPALLMTTKMELDFGMDVCQGLNVMNPLQEKMATWEIKPQELKRDFHMWLTNVKKEFVTLNKGVEEDFVKKTSTKAPSSNTSALHPAAPHKSYTNSASKGRSINLGKNGINHPVPMALLPADRSTTTPPPACVNLYSKVSILKIDDRSASLGVSINVQKDNSIRAVPAALLPPKQQISKSTVTVRIDAAEPPSKSLTAPAAGTLQKHNISSASKGRSINLGKNGINHPIPMALLPADRSTTTPPPPIVNLYKSNTLLKIDGDHTASMGVSINVQKDNSIRGVPAALLPMPPKQVPSTPGPDELHRRPNKSLKLVKKLRKMTKANKYSSRDRAV